MVLQKDNYYVVTGTSVNKTKVEEILVYYCGSRVYVEHDFKEEGPQTKHEFEIVAWLTDCSEGAPETGQRELIDEDDLKDMEKDGFSFREPTSTELVLYAKAR